MSGSKVTFGVLTMLLIWAWYQSALQAGTSRDPPADMSLHAVMIFRQGTFALYIVINYLWRTLHHCVRQCCNSRANWKHACTAVWSENVRMWWESTVLSVSNLLLCHVNLRLLLRLNGKAARACMSRTWVDIVQYTLVWHCSSQRTPK